MNSNSETIAANRAVNSDGDVFGGARDRGLRIHRACLATSLAGKAYARRLGSDNVKAFNLMFNLLLGGAGEWLLCGSNCSSSHCRGC